MEYISFDLYLCMRLSMNALLCDYSETAENHPEFKMCVDHLERQRNIYKFDLFSVKYYTIFRCLGYSGFSVFCGLCWQCVAMRFRSKNLRRPPDADLQMCKMWLGLRDWGLCHVMRVCSIYIYCK